MIKSMCDHLSFGTTGSGVIVGVGAVGDVVEVIVEGVIVHAGVIAGASEPGYAFESFRSVPANISSISL
ncbi:MAG: hypothetical protein KAT65_18475 [Methanophagales archaeon]|nr:hypothetical protein [Methanophagales archaeon]